MTRYIVKTVNGSLYEVSDNEHILRDPTHWKIVIDKIELEIIVLHDGKGNAQVPKQINDFLGRRITCGKKGAKITSTDEAINTSEVIEIYQLIKVKK